MSPKFGFRFELSKGFKTGPVPRADVHTRYLIILSILEDNFQVS